MPPYIYCKNEGPHSAHSWNSKLAEGAPEYLKHYSYHWCPGLKAPDGKE